MKTPSCASTKSGPNRCRLLRGRAAAFGLAGGIFGFVLGPLFSEMVMRAAALVFDAPRTYATSPLPYQIIALDLDADGDLDMAVAESPPLSDPVLELFENPGDGTFVRRGALPLLSGNRLVRGDFNHDGRPDLAQVRRLDLLRGELRTWIQTEPFTFAPRTLALPFGATVLAAGDLDGRFGEDLIIGDEASDARIGIYFSDANGMFAAGGQYVTEAYDRDVNADGMLDRNSRVNLDSCFVADLDGDGRNDLLVGNKIERYLSYREPGTTNYSFTNLVVGNVVRLLNLGEGEFRPWELVADPHSRPAPGVVSLANLAVGDLDGDRDLDLVVIDRFDVTVLCNRGDWSFLPARRFPTGETWMPGRPELVDVDGDGDLDVAMPVPCIMPGSLTDPPTEHWTLLRNNGAGEFGAPERYPGGAAIMDFIFANLDGAPGPEAVVLNGPAQRFAVIDNRCGRFCAPPQISIVDPRSSLGNTVPHDLVAGDFNNDGRSELAITASTHGLAAMGPEPLIFLAGPTADVWPQPVFFDIHEGAGPVTALPIAGGKATDLVTVHLGDRLWGVPDGISLILGGESQWPSQATFLATPDLGPMAGTGLDLDGNGTRDLALLGYGSGAETARILVIEVAANGAMTPKGNLLLGDDDILSGDTRSPGVIAAGDLDGDGRDDLVAVTYRFLRPTAPIVSIILNQGDYAFALAGEFEESTGEIADLCLADVNGDRRLDVILLLDVVNVLLQEPGGGLAAPVSYPVGAGPVRMAAAELDGRPGIDLVVANDLSNEVTLLRNDGHGGFMVQERYLTFGGTDGLAVADFDADGWADVAVVNDDFDLATFPNHKPTVSLLKSIRSNAPRLRIETANDQVVLRLSGLDGAGVFALERSGNLTVGSWGIVARFGGVGTTNWSESLAGPSSRAFYRLKWNAP